MLTAKKLVKIKILDSVDCEILDGFNFIKPVLSFEAVYWRRARYGKKKEVWTKCLIRDKKYFYLGWLERVEDYCCQNQIVCVVEGEREFLEPTNEPHVKGIDFRSYQPKFIKTAIEKQRGVLVAVMAAGKTMIAIAVASCFKDSKVLFLLHEKELMYQTKEEFDKFGYNTSQLGDGVKDISGDVVCATIQSAKNLDFDKVSDMFDIIFVDEAHIGIKEGGMIEKILRNLLAPIKLGLTATPPKEKEKILLTEGLLGPKLEELNFQDAKKEGIVADAFVDIVDVPKQKKFNSLIQIAKDNDKEENKKIVILNRSIKDKKKKIKKINKTNYQYHYQIGIIENVVRNNLIVAKTLALTKQGKSCIVFAMRHDHIHNLSDMFKFAGIEHGVVYGNTSTEERKKFKKELGEKKILVVVASVIWVAGINIPSLDAINNAGGGKDYKALLQKAGRSMRKHDGKDKAIVIDYMDTKVKYLHDHSKLRIIEYEKLGWL